MPSNNTSETKNPSFTKKVWITVGIVLLVVVFFLLFKTLLSLLLLILAGVLMAIYFYGCAGLLQRLYLSEKLSIIVSVILNILLLAGFLWFMGARLQQQIAELSDTLQKPFNMQKIK